MTQTVVSVRERLLDASQGMIEDSGWSSVTMSRVAETAGVSRQTVYNEFGTKHGLAEQLALRELQRFLDVVRDRMGAESDVVAGIQSGCEGALVMGEQSLLVRSILGSAPDDHDSDFLKILTTESGAIIEAAVAAVRQCVEDFYPPLPLSAAEMTVIVEAVVRLVLSAITRPAKAPPEAAADIAWIIGLFLKGSRSRISS